jgi:adenosylhomocysteine nucleosidase
VLLLETGIGATAMETALRWCLGEPRLGNFRYRPSRLLCAGFSGALQPEQGVGDLVVATEVVDQQGDHWQAMIPDAWVGQGITTGRLLTMPELVSDPHEKRRLGRCYGALAVDMESAIAARLCHQHSTPFACLRVISDDWQTTLSPHLVELLGQELVSIPRLVRKVLRHPMLIAELWRLAGQTRRASRRLLSPLSALIRVGLRARALG